MQVTRRTDKTHSLSVFLSFSLSTYTSTHTYVNYMVFIIARKHRNSQDASKNRPANHFKATEALNNEKALPS